MLWKQKDQQNITKDEFNYMKSKKLLSAETLKQQEQKQKQMTLKETLDEIEERKSVAFTDSLSQSYTSSQKWE